LDEIVSGFGDGQGADIVFDGVGAATLDLSLALLKPFGQLALFGQASGAVAPIEPARLAGRSLAIWRPIVFHHASDPLRYRTSAGRVFDEISAGTLVIQEPGKLPLRDAAEAHARLESGATTGSTILVV